MSTSQTHEEVEARQSETDEFNRRYREMMQAAANLYGAYFKYGSRSDKTLDSLDEFVERYDDYLG